MNHWIFNIPYVQHYAFSLYYIPTCTTNCSTVNSTLLHIHFLHKKSVTKTPDPRSCLVNIGFCTFYNGQILTTFSQFSHYGVTIRAGYFFLFLFGQLCFLQIFITFFHFKQSFNCKLSHGVQCDNSLTDSKNICL